MIYRKDKVKWQPGKKWLAVRTSQLANLAILERKLKRKPCKPNDWSKLTPELKTCLLSKLTPVQKKHLLFALVSIGKKTQHSQFESLKTLSKSVFDFSDAFSKECHLGKFLHGLVKDRLLLATGWSGAKTRKDFPAEHFRLKKVVVGDGPDDGRCTDYYVNAFYFYGKFRLEMYQLGSILSVEEALKKGNLLFFLFWNWLDGELKRMFAPSGAFEPGTIFSFVPEQMVIAERFVPFLEKNKEKIAATFPNNSSFLKPLLDAYYSGKRQEVRSLTEADIQAIKADISRLRKKS